MSIKRISIRNLFSYKAIDIDLSPGLNVVVGKNGSGKSNLMNSLLFVLTDKFSQRDRKMIENNLIQDVPQTIQVTLIIDNSRKRLPYVTDDVTVVRQMNEKDEYFVNGKPVTVSQFSNILQCINLSRSNYYNIVRQGKIARIASMKDTDVFELLEEVSGVALYEKKKQETQEHMKQAQLEKEEIVKILSDLGDQIKQLHDQKEAFNQLKDIQKQVQLYEIQLSLISAKQFKHQLAEMNAEQSKMHNQLQSFTTTYQQVSDTQFKAIKEIELFGRFVDETEQQLNELNQGLESIKGNFKQLQDQEKQVNNKLKTLQIPVEDWKSKEVDIDKQILSIQEEQSKIDKELQYFQILQTDDPVKRFKEEVGTLSKSLEGYQKEYNNVQFKISQLQKELNVMKSSQNSNLNVNLLQEELKKQEVILQNLRKKLETSQLDDMELQRKKTLLQQQLCKLQNESDIECNQLDKQMRDIFTISILKIFEFAEMKQLTIYGVFAQLMTVKQKRLLPLIETASGPRLFSLIVPDTQTAKIIIDFNREQQGSVLRIYPLDLIDDRVHQFETPKDTINLQEQITLSGDFPHKKSLIAKVVGKWVAVKDYQAALDISQQYEINCITQENEVVYADSFLTKVGATRVQQSKTLQLQKILAMNDEIRKLQRAEREMDLNIEEDAHTLLEIQREIQQHKNIQTGLQQQLQSQDVKQLEKKQNEIDSLEQLARQLDIPIQDTKNQISEIQQKLKNPKQIKKMTGANIDTIQHLVKAKQELSAALMDLMRQKNETKLARNKKVDPGKLQSLRQDSNDMQQQLEQLQNQIKGKTRYQQELSDQLKDQKQQLNKAIKEKDTCKQELCNLEMNMESIKNAQTDMEKQIQSCMDMIDQVEKEKKLVDAFTEIDELESRNQIIKKIKELKQRFNQKFTQKDQSLFEKLNDIENKFQEYQKKLENLKQVQSDFDRLCQLMDQKADNILADQLFKKFAEYFRHYFLQIVTTGDCSVKLIKGVRKNSKKNWAVDIKISFKNKELQNWTSFSSGEKTIVAFVILIALQKCDPAPFYILDEFDAALDDNYRNQVAQIILQLSRQSQYLIITFRPELINLNSDDVSFYKVAHHNQQSSIVKTTKQEAQKILKV